MIIRETIAKLLSNLAPLALIKQVFPVQKTTQAYSHPTYENKPWMNVDEIEITVEDLA